PLTPETACARGRDETRLRRITFSEVAFKHVARYTTSTYHANPRPAPAPAPPVRRAPGWCAPGRRPAPRRTPRARRGRGPRRRQAAGHGDDRPGSRRLEPGRARPRRRRV